MWFRTAIVLPLIIAGLACLSVAGCDALEGTPVLTWTDGNSGATFTVKTQLSGDTTLYQLQVTRDDKMLREILCDHVDIRTLTLLRYNDWILVLSGPYVIGGYDYDSDAIVGLNSSKLPFTQRGNGGIEVASVELRDSGPEGEPFDFDSRPE